jgi:fructose-1,6-bisphosphatase II
MPDDGYYSKIATGPQCKGKLSMDMTVEEIVETVASCKGKLLENLTVIMLDRERHLGILRKLRKLGVRISLIPDGDIAASVVTCLPDSGIDLLLGAGKGPEATIAATAVKCLGGTMLVKVYRDEKGDAGRLLRLKEAGVDVDKVYSEGDLAKGDHMVFSASGITNGELLNGVKFTSAGAVVHSLSVRLPSGTLELSTTRLSFEGHPVYKHFKKMYIN